MQNVNRAAKECNPNIKLVAAGYADAERAGTLDPMLIPEIASNAGVDVAMLDTAVKDDKNLFNFLTSEQLAKFVNCSHKFGLRSCFGGFFKKTGFTFSLQFRR